MTHTEILDALIAARVPADVLLAVTELIAAANAMEIQDAIEAERRQSNRDRMRAMRARARTLQHVQNRSAQVSTLSFLREDSKKEDSKKEDSKKERNSCGTRLPEDWKPHPSHYDTGAGRGLSRAQVDSHAEDMRLWAQANANRQVARKADWDKTFAGWLRRAAPTKTTEKQRQVSTPPSEETLKSIAEARELMRNGKLKEFGNDNN